jgi:hypothetical protein
MLGMDLAVRIERILVGGRTPAAAQGIGAHFGFAILEAHGTCGELDSGAALHRIIIRSRVGFIALNGAIAVIFLLDAGVRLGRSVGRQGCWANAARAESAPAPVM